MKWFIAGGLALILLGTSPIFGILLAERLAEVHGCVVNEARVNPCMIDGVDRGGLLYSLFVMGWLLLLSLPLALVGVVLVVVGLGMRAGQRRRGR